MFSIAVSVIGERFFRSLAAFYIPLATGSSDDSVANWCDAERRLQLEPQVCEKNDTLKPHALAAAKSLLLKLAASNNEKGAKELLGGGKQTSNGKDPSKGKCLGVMRVEYVDHATSSPSSELVVAISGHFSNPWLPGNTATVIASSQTDLIDAAVQSGMTFAPFQPIAAARTYKQHSQEL